MTLGFNCMFFAAAYELLPAKANSYQNPNANTITNANTNTRTTDRLMMLYVFGMAMTKGV